MFKGPQGMSLAGNAAPTASAAAVAVVSCYCSTIFLNGHIGQIGL